MKKLILLITIAAFFSSCAKKDKIAGVEKPDLKNRSNAPAFIEMFPEFSAVKAYTLLSSGDTIQGSPNFVYGGAPDGQGFLKNPDGTGYVMVTNN